ncbi:MAG: ABC transporter ATP-binding protein [Succinivibrionaceae bacterium]|nr:ABC transporter ATP-binding protein [Succinivibrionaceae bacterium]
MIRMENLTKKFRLKNGGYKYVLDDVSYTFEEGVNTGILGLNGTGKSTLLKLLCGSSLPSSGRVTRNSTISWPVGFTGFVVGNLTGYQNLRFISRIYKSDYRKDRRFVEEFTELGDYLNEPVKTYSSGMRSKLNFALSMAIGFDFYLIDEAFSVGDAAFRKKGEEIFQQRMKESTVIVVSHSISNITKLCSKAVVLDQAKFHTYETLDEAVEVYKTLGAKRTAAVNRGAAGKA